MQHLLRLLVEVVVVLLDLDILQQVEAEVEVDVCQVLFLEEMEVQEEELLIHQQEQVVQEILHQ